MSRTQATESRWRRTQIALHDTFFPGIPFTYPFHKKIKLLKESSAFGYYYDFALVMTAVVACGLYVCETYTDALYAAVRVYFICDAIITAIFTFDFVFAALAAYSITRYLMSPWTIVDMATILPFYVELGHATLNINFVGLRFLRLLRLLRVFRVFRLLRSVQGVQKQVAVVAITVTCFVFVGAGIEQVMENDVKQIMEFMCNYIGPNTNYQPSCSPDVLQLDDIVCDCEINNCRLFYNRYDMPGQPSGVKCVSLTFFDAFYFLVVTVGTLGYGDVHPTTDLSRLVIMWVIILSLIIIPVQVERLGRIIKATSQYRQPYEKSRTESHIILCGNVNERDKVERFLTEFFHPDKVFTRNFDLRVLLLSPLEPVEDIKDMLTSPELGRVVTYVVGSALSSDDLKRAHAHTAEAMFFLCDAVVNEETAVLNDAATVLRVLSVKNYNPHIDCYAQIVKRTDRDILRNAEVDVILSLDEFRTTVQARNAVCPGMSTLIENLFHTYGEDHDDHDNQPRAAVAGPTTQASWLDEYVAGADIEAHYVELSTFYVERMRFTWSMIAEGVFLEYGAIMVAVCCQEDSTLIMCPSRTDASLQADPPAFYARYKTGVVLCGSYEESAAISQGLEDRDVVMRIVAKLVDAEAGLHVRTPMNLAESSEQTPTAPTRKLSLGLLRPGGSFRESFRGSLLGEPNSPPSNRRPSVNSSGSETPVAAAPRPKSTRALLRDIGALNRIISSERTFMAGQSTSLKDVSLHHGFVLHDRDHDFTGEVAVGHQYGAQRHLHMTEAARKKEESERVKQRRGNVNGSSRRSVTEAHAEVPEEDYYTSSDEEDNEKFTSPSAAGGGGSGAMWSGRDSNASTRGSTPAAAAASARHVVPSSPASSSKDDWVSATPASASSRGVKPVLKQAYGHASREIENATNLNGHVIVFGNGKCVDIFVEEMRRDAVSCYAYRPVVFVGATPPAGWDDLRVTFDDVYWLRGDMTKSFDFNRSNVSAASAVVLLADRNKLARVDDEHLDATNLFAYMLLEKHMPLNVFFTAELTFESNVVVLNSSVEHRIDQEKEKASTAMSAETSQKSDVSASLPGGGLRGRQASIGSLRLSSVMGRDWAGIGKDWSTKNGTADGSSRSQPAPPVAVIRNPSTMPLGPQAGTRAALEVAKFETGSSLIFQQNQLKMGKKAVDVHVDLHAEVVAPMTQVRDAHSILSTHHTLPVFASGRAFVPSAIDNILSNSFFNAFAPMLCERLLCGQKVKAMFQIAVPTSFVGRPFVDLYRALISRGVCVIALYRSPRPNEGNAILPYVYTCPARHAVLRARDRVFVYCHPLELDYALHTTNGFSIVTGPSETAYLADNDAKYAGSAEKYRSADMHTRNYEFRPKAEQENPLSQRGGPLRRSLDLTSAGVLKVPDTLHEHDEEGDDGTGGNTPETAKKPTEKKNADDNGGLEVLSVTPSPETSGRVPADGNERRGEQKREELSPSSHDSAKTASGGLVDRSTQNS